MLSIWPQLAADEEKAMTEKGFVLGRNIYDAFNPAARKMYWDNYVYKNLFIKGVDAWWCDSSEPEMELVGSQFRRQNRRNSAVERSLQMER